MVCERCQARAATVHATALAGGRAVRAIHLCEPCARTPRPVDLEEAGAVLRLEASGRAMPPGWFAAVAADLRGRSEHHGQPLPPDVQAFVARHAPPAT